MAAPLCITVCGSVGAAGPTPPSDLCAQTGARVSTDDPQSIPVGVDTQVAFDTDDFEVPPTDADAAADRIVIGAPGIYLVELELLYGPASDDGSATATIRVNDVPRASFVQPLNAGSAPVLAALARYYIDEAASGQAPLQVLDSEPAPLHLTTVYVGDTPEYTAIASGRGLNFPSPNTSPGAGSFYLSLAPGDKVYDAINGSTTATLEMVVTIPQSVLDGGAFSRQIFGIDSEDGQAVTISVWYDGFANALTFDITGPGGYRSYRYAIAAPGTYVIHARFNSNEVVPIDRLQLFIDGVFLASFDQVQGFVALGETLVIPNDGTHGIALGAIFNPVGLNATWDGAIFESAIYESALTPVEISARAAMLIANNDEPATPPGAQTSQNVVTFLTLSTGDVLTLFVEQDANLEGLALLSAAMTALRQAC